MWSFEIESTIKSLYWRLFLSFYSFAEVAFDINEACRGCMRQPLSLLYLVLMICAIPFIYFSATDASNDEWNPVIIVSKVLLEQEKEERAKKLASAIICFTVSGYHILLMKCCL
jgi:hypothetical protein